MEDDKKQNGQDDWRQRDDVPDIVWKLEARRARYSRRSLAFRIGWTVLAFLITIAGIVMIIVPGPAIVFIPAGLAMLSFEFTWAQRILDFALTRGMDAKEYAEHLDRRKRRAAMIAAACVSAAVIGAALYYWFYWRQPGAG
ncbi:MAG TPA: PGPGW domain-containing protein [Gammaproteobacteria bacterium]|nr:PGPGW domain-containing protein [Gammaproteobacteria bacterium]